MHIFIKLVKKLVNFRQKEVLGSQKEQKKKNKQNKKRNQLQPFLSLFAKLHPNMRHFWLFSEQFLKQLA